MHCLKTLFLSAVICAVSESSAAPKVKSSIDAKDYAGDTALVRAARNGQYSHVRELLRQGALPSVRGGTKRTALMELIWDGFDAGVGFLARELMLLLNPEKKMLKQGFTQSSTALSDDKKTLYGLYKNSEQEFVQAAAHLMIAGIACKGALQKTPAGYDVKTGLPIHLNEAYMNLRCTHKQSGRVYTFNTLQLLRVSQVEYLKPAIMKALSLDMLNGAQRGQYEHRLYGLHVQQGAASKKRSYDNDDERPCVKQSRASL